MDKPPFLFTSIFVIKYTVIMSLDYKYTKVMD